MIHYAISVKGASVLRPDWIAAARTARIRKMELSLPFAPSPEDSSKHLKILKELRRETGFSVVSFHLPFAPFDVWEYTAADETARVRTVSMAKDLLLRYRELGFHNVTVHSGGEPNRPEDRAAKMESMRKTVSDLLPVLEEMNLSLNLELLPRSCIGNCESDLLAMTEDFSPDHVNICFDVNHLNGRCPEIPSAVRTLAPRIRSFHLSDYDGVDEDHWTIGQGLIDWVALREAIHALPQDLLLILETDPVKARQDREVDPAIWFRNAVHAFRELEFANELQKMEKSMTF